MEAVEARDIKTYARSTKEILWGGTLTKKQSNKKRIIKREGPSQKSEKKRPNKPNHRRRSKL